MGPHESAKNIKINGQPFNGTIPTVNFIRVGKCPFCKSERAKPQRYGAYRVICTDCSAQGPVGASEVQAVEKWNESSNHESL